MLQGYILLRHLFIYLENIVNRVNSRVVFGSDFLNITLYLNVYCVIFLKCLHAQVQTNCLSLIDP